MDHPPQQHFCTTCGQPPTPGAAFCVACGTQISAPSTGTPGSFSAGTQSDDPLPYVQAPTPVQDDPLLTGLAAGYVANRMERPLQRQARQRSRRARSRLSGCGCLLLILVVLAALAGPFIGLALTSGSLHQIFAYVAGGMVIFFILVVLIGMLATRRGREVLIEGIFEGILDGLFGGG